MEPKIRLKGFEGDWVLTSWGKLTQDFKYGINASAVPFDGTNKYLRITDIDDETRKFSQTDITTPGTNLSLFKEYIMQDGDIAIARTGASVGKTYIYRPSDGKVYWAGYLIRMRLPNDAEHEFVFQNSLTDKFRKYIGLVSQRSGQPGINVDELKSYIFYLPEQKDEQHRIGEFLKSIDNQISASEAKLASLKQVKAASLQAMFPQEGELVPRLRFKGFERDWEKKKFTSLYKRSNIKNDLSYGADKIISVANMYFINSKDEIDTDYLRSYNVMQLGDIAFEGNKSKKYAHGRFVENTIGDGIVSHVFVVLKPISVKYDLNFWKYYINNEDVMGNILVRSTKSSTMMTDIIVDDFLNESILVPSYEEQVLIGNYLAGIDAQISLYSQRLEKLKQIKSACLDSMFV